MGQFLDSIRTVKQNYGVYDEWEQIQANERAQKEYLAKNYPPPKDKIELTSKKSQVVIRATEIMDKRSEDNCEDTEQATGMVMGLVVGGALMARQTISAIFDNGKNISKQVMRGVIADVLIAIGVGSAMMLWGTEKQKDASRIGRFQAMQNDLKDINNFVMYTPEQIQQAQKITKTLPDEKDEKNNLIASIKNLRSISKDKEAYKDFVNSKDPNEIEKLKNRNLTQAQIKAANEDKELIVDTVKEINIKAEEYSENLENAFDTLEDTSFLIAVPFGIAVNKLLNILKFNGPRGIISSTIATMMPFVIQAIGTMEQKEASRIGRYQARKDLSKNPARLMAYSDDEMKKAQNITAPVQKKSFKEKITDSFSFITQYYKDKKEYEKYRKTTQKEQERLQKALSEVKITDKQRKEAENLQKKVFIAFNEIDEMSQRYSEDVEAGCDIVKNAANQVFGLLPILALIAGGMAVEKGKFPFSKIVNTLTNIGLKKESSLRKSINEFYGALKENNLIQKFQHSLVQGEFDKFITSKEAQKILPSYNRFLSETTKLNDNESIKKHLKDGYLSKYFRNLVSESIDVYARVQIDKLPTKEARENAKKLMPKKKISDYKAFIGTAAAVSAPLIVTCTAVPYVLNSQLTDIQKKAGKIGIMKAMEQIDDPRVFADDNYIAPEEEKTLKKRQPNSIFSEFKTI